MGYISLVFISILLFGNLSISLGNLGPFYRNDQENGNGMEEDDGGHFCYEDEECGPNSGSWYGDCKTGTHQSPIDIPHPGGDPVGEPWQLKFNDKYYTTDYWIYNNGHTIQLQLANVPNSQAVFQMGGDAAVYTFAQAHFHWDYDKGSEHAIAGKHFDMEVHLVHYDSFYASLADAAADTKNPKALTVIARFIEAVDDDSLTDHDETFNNIVGHMPHKYPGKKHVSGGRYTAMEFNDFLPRSGENVFQYAGSLTTPGCMEIVNWIVIEQPIYVSESVLRKFSQVQSVEKGKPVGQNFRPTQDINGRTIAYESVRKNPRFFHIMVDRIKNYVKYPNKFVDRVKGIVSNIKLPW